MFELTTPRLWLRDFIEADWHVVYVMSQEPAITRYQSWLRLASEDAARAWVARAMHHNQLQPRTAYNLALVERDSQHVVGWFGWGVPSDLLLGDLDFGYALIHDYWGRGYMTETLHAGLAYMFAHLGACRVCGECASSNHGSARVMEKNAMVLVDRGQEADEHAGVTEEQCCYAITKEAWLAQHSL